MISFMLFLSRSFRFETAVRVKHYLAMAFSAMVVITLPSPGIAGSGNFAYIADTNLLGLEELYFGNSKGVVSKVSPALVAGGRVIDFWMDPKAKYIYYMADQQVDERIELYRVEVKTKSWEKLSSTLVANGDVLDFQVDPKGKFVVYRADGITDTVAQLFKVDLATKDVTLASDVIDGVFDVLGFQIRPNSSTDVVYRSDHLLDNSYRLFIKSDGLPSNPVSPVNVAEGDVVDFEIDPTGTYVIYRGDVDDDPVSQLYATHLETGEVRNISGPLVMGGNVDTFRIDPKGKFVVFRADKTTDDVLKSIK